LSFVEYLETKLRENAPRQKGERTRERIKIATAKMLEERGYHDMRVTDITQSAGVAEGSFYVYFKDKKDVSLTVLGEFLKQFLELRAPVDEMHPPFNAIRAANRRWLALCRANSGLMRCVLQVGDDQHDFARLVDKTKHEWYEHISRSVKPDHPNVSGHAMLLAAYCLASMMDEILRKLIIYPDREFLKLLKSWSADDNAIADSVTLIWMRVLGVTVKLPEDLPPVTMELARMMWWRAK
jgi:AcrR family transcriptional regulator